MDYSTRQLCILIAFNEDGFEGSCVGVRMHDLCVWDVLKTCNIVIACHDLPSLQEYVMAILILLLRIQLFSEPLICVYILPTYKIVVHMVCCKTPNKTNKNVQIFDLKWLD